MPVFLIRLNYARSGAMFPERLTFATFLKSCNVCASNMALFRPSNSPRPNVHSVQCYQPAKLSVIIVHTLTDTFYRWLSWSRYPQLLCKPKVHCRVQKSRLFDPTPGQL